MAPDSEKRVRVAFYRTAAGNLPVREWLKDLDPEDRKIVGDDLRTVELGWPLGMPLCRSLSSHKGLWEVRSALPGNREARVLFCLAEGCNCATYDSYSTPVLPTAQPPPYVTV